MITENEKEDPAAIEDDKQEFIAYAQNKGYSLEVIMDFMDQYENLITFEDNTRKMEFMLVNDWGKE